MKVAILAADGFEQSELEEPKRALEQAGVKTVVVSPVKGKIKGWKGKDWGTDVPVDLDLEKARAEDFDALLLPGGLFNPDTLRMNPKAVDFVRGFVKSHKPIGAICHGPWMLINAEGVRGKKMTSYASIQVDLINAGAKWVDQEVVTDGNIVTSRSPKDLPAFNEAIIELFLHSKAGAR